MPALKRHPYLEAEAELRAEVGVRPEDARFVVMVVLPADAHGTAAALWTAARADADAALRVLTPLARSYYQAHRRRGADAVRVLVAAVTPEGWLALTPDPRGGYWVGRKKVPVPGRPGFAYDAVVARVANLARAQAVLACAGDIATWQVEERWHDRPSVWDGDRLLVN